MRPILALVLCTGLVACGTHDKDVRLNFAVCQKVIAPAQIPLKHFEFRKLESVTPGGPVFGLTESDSSAVLDNFNILKARDGKWQARADSTNACIDRNTKPTPPADTPVAKPRKRFGLF